MLGEMFRGSSHVKKNFAATDPVRRAREASWPLRRAMPLLNWRAVEKPHEFLRCEAASFHSDLSNWKVQSECELRLMTPDQLK